MQDEKIKVLYIGGSGRSGSTLLERILGQLDHFVAVGELRHIWDKSFSDNQLCSCGKHFRDCEFWQAVTQEAFGQLSQNEIEEIKALKNSIDRVRYIPQLLWKSAKHEQASNAVKYEKILTKLYKAIKKVSGAEFIVDASKDPSTAYFLRTMKCIDLHVLHLVRDSRAVAFSWQRKKVFRPEISGEQSYMATYSLSYSSMDWVYRNILINMLQYLTPKYLRIQYEMLMQEPQKLLEIIQEFVQTPQTDYDFVRHNKLHLQIGHTATGNPFRFKYGDVTLRFDNEWQQKMSKMDQAIVTLMSFPLLYHYGYPLLTKKACSSS